MKNAVSPAPQRYAAPFISLHWLMALVLLGLLVMGLTLEEMAPTPQKFQLIMLHKSVGILALLLVVVRLAMRVMLPAPRLPEGTPRWQVGLAHAVHAGLYGLMVAMPVSGWLMSDAKGYHPTPFGFDVLPTLMAPNEAVAGIFKEAHEIGGALFWALLAAHVGAALYHRFILKDGIVQRMLPAWLANRLA